MGDSSAINLSVRPFVRPDESYPGYLLRLGAANGLLKSKYIIELLRLPTKTAVWHRIDGRAAYNAVSASTGRSDLQARMLLERADKRFPELADAAIGSSRIDEPRICLKCMRQPQPYLRWYWQSILVSHCPDHDMRLISECPNPQCGRRLKWEPTLLDACPHCGNRWAEMDLTGLQLLTPFTQLERNVASALALENYPERSFYKDLTRAMMLVARSFDFMSDELRSVPSSSNLSTIINAAYWLITSVEVEIHYKNLKYIELGLICVFGNQAVASLDEFQFNSQLAEKAYASEQIDPVRNQDLLFFDDPVFISSRRRRACDQGLDSARFHLDGRALKVLLGDIPDVVTTLREEKALTPIYHTRADRDQIFDASELMAFAMRCLTDSVPDHYLAVHPESRSLREHGNNYARVLSWVLTGQLDGYLHPDSGFKVLYVDPVPFTVISRQHLAGICNDPVPLVLATQVLGLEAEEIKSLVRREVLPLAKYSRSSWMLDGPKFYQYVISSRVQHGAADRRAALQSSSSF